MKIVAIVIALLALILVGVRLASRSAPSHAGLVDGRLKPCPETPNCASTLTDPTLEALVFQGDAPRAMKRLKKVMAKFPRIRLVSEGPDYLHYEVKSLVFGFVDDVEFKIEPALKQIQVRSASRVGHSDLGVNRARVESIREAWQNQGQINSSSS